MHRIQQTLIASLLGALALGACAEEAPRRQADAPPATIDALDLPRYMGTWYEIARYPNRFQKKCAGFTRADYALEPDGRVQVINRCRLENGETNVAHGSGRQLGDARSPRLEVRFAPAWLSFIPAVWGDYWVIDLDEQYRLAAVSDSRRKYLWILSRTPQVAQADYAALLERLSRKGFDIGKLQLTRQE